MSAEIPVEIWIKIITYLRHPIPKPNDDRSSLAQQDLTSIIRTCKLFQAIGEKLLYTHITVDRPFLLSPEHLPARRRLFAHTQSLRLEYIEKNLDLKYADLVEFGGEAWTSIGAVGEAVAREIMWHCIKETQFLIRCFTELNSSGPITDTFPQLRALAVGSLFGGQEGIWGGYNENITKGLMQAVPSSTGGKTEYFPCPDPETCRRLLYDFCESSNLDHFCAPSHKGPLQMPTTFLPVGHKPKSPSTTNTIAIGIPKAHLSSMPGCAASGPSNHYNFTAHLSGASLSEAQHLPLSHGMPTIWIVDLSDINDSGVVYRGLHELAASVNEGRGHLSLVGGNVTAAVDIQMYGDVSFDESNPLLANLESALSPGSNTTPTHAEKHRMLIQGMGESIQAQLRMGSGLDDHFTWRGSDEAPPCPACNFPPST